MSCFRYVVKVAADSVQSSEKGGCRHLSPKRGKRLFVDPSPAAGLPIHQIDTKKDADDWKQGNRSGEKVATTSDWHDRFYLGR